MKTEKDEDIFDLELKLLEVTCHLIASRFNFYREIFAKPENSLHFMDTKIICERFKRYCGTYVNDLVFHFSQRGQC